MSAIFGIINFQQQLVSSEVLCQMRNPMEYWGPNGGNIWSERKIGLGQLHLYNTPESVHENLPMISQDGHFIITAAARIDNRNELFHKLNLNRQDKTSITDSFLILKAYEKWGEQCPQYLLGDWSFAIWDKLKQKLFIARDHHGNTGLYYYSNTKYFAFSSSIKGILALNIPVELNELRIAQILVSWPEHGEKTCYKNIYRLPPAHSLSIENEKIKINRYWHLENAPEIKYQSNSEYIESFLELYQQAVNVRLRSHLPVGVTLSGGLDSGSVAALAARELKKQDKRLPAFTSIPLYNTDFLKGSNRFGNELLFAQKTAEFAGNIDITTIDGSNISSLEAIKYSLFLHEEPEHAAANLFWIHAIMKEAQSKGLGAILTGQCGNATVSWPTSGFLKKSIADFRLQDFSSFNAIRQKIISPLVPFEIKQWYKKQRGGKLPFLNYAAINPEFAKQLQLLDLMLASDHDPWFRSGKDPKIAQISLIKPGSNIIGSLWNENGAGFNLNILDPTQDKSLMEFCVGVPMEQYIMQGKDRMLIRRAMNGIMPDSVRWNTLRGAQSADIGYRIEKDKTSLINCINEIKQSALANKIIDIKKIEAIINHSYQPIDKEYTNKIGSIVLRGIMMGLFLCRDKQ